MEFVVIAIVAAVVLALVIWSLMRAFRGGEPARRAEGGAPTGGVVERVIDVSTNRADDPAVERLVAEIAARVFADTDDVEEVVVKNRDGAVLGRVPRRPEAREPSDLPPDLSVHHRPRGTSRRAPPPAVEPTTELPAERPERARADQFQLPEAVIEETRDPDDLVDLLRAILAVGGTSPVVDGNVVRAADVAFVVVRAPSGRSLSGDDLTRAFHQFQSSGAPRGYLVLLGYADARELRRREALAPNVEYVGPEAIQRMADAVAVGADPLTFASPPRGSD